MCAIQYAPDTGGIVALQAATTAKIRMRLALPLIAFMFLGSIDRVNVSFASLHMNEDLGFTPAQYGFGASILFLGFLAGQYPSILLLQRVGMRWWLAGGTLLWGICAGAMAFIETPTQFYVLRVLLGFAEAALAPGIVLYLSQFATERERATTFALPMIAVPCAVMAGGPLSGWLLGMEPPFGMATWRWMLLAEAVPTLFFAAFALLYFPNTPSEAKFLSDDEKAWLASNAANRAETAKKNDWSVLKLPIVWASALLWFCILSGAYGIMFWLPQIVDQLTDMTPLQIGLISVLPWIGNVLGVYLNAQHSDKTGERFWHISIPAAVTGLAIFGASVFGATALGLIFLIIAGTGLGAAQGAFWALPTKAFTPATFAVGAVAINITGVSGGLIVPWLVGVVRESTGAFLAPSLLMTALLLTASLMVGLIALISREKAA